MNSLSRRLVQKGPVRSIQCVDSTLLPWEYHLFGCTRPKSCQGSVPAGLTLLGDFGFCFQCKGASSLVLRRPIEITRETGNQESVIGNRVNKGLTALIQQLLILALLMVSKYAHEAPR